MAQTRTEGEFSVVRCLDCGDTFSTHDVENAVCPSCGGTRVELAAEPLL